MNLSNLKQKLSEQFTRILILVLLIASLAFGLGYILGRDWNPAPIMIEKSSN